MQEALTTELPNTEATRQRTAELFQQQCDTIYNRTDRMFAVLMIVQWLAGVALALLISPKTWAGESSQVHPHVWAALVLGGAITSLPVIMAFAFSGRVITRHVIAVGQMLMAGLLIHLTGGRIETHFHVFGSLAFLAFYRDWRVMITATVVVATDHLVRGLYWPQSVYGVLTASPWRTLEHAGWVVFEVTILIISIRKSMGDMFGLAERQARLEATNEALHIEIAERARTQALKEFATKLERSNRELQDFASVASHDLQEPLRKIQAFGDRLKTKYAGVLGTDGKDYLERMLNASSRMQTLINDLLTFSRVTSKAQPFVNVDLATITREVLSDLEIRVQQTGGRVDLGELPTLEADPLQMRQLLQNLIANALKFRKSDTPPVVKLSYLPVPNNGHCQIFVEDNGIGFDEKYLDRIFAVFQRLHGRNEYEGTGIGLAVCRKIAERHGGSITATSQPGQGSKFIITLPYSQTKEDH